MEKYGNGSFGVGTQILRKMNGQKRSEIHIGDLVAIVLKADQRTGNLTEGVVSQILTKSQFHPHGIKVRLEDGQVGRVKKVLDDN